MSTKIRKCALVGASESVEEQLLVGASDSLEEQLACLHGRLGRNPFSDSFTEYYTTIHRPFYGYLLWMERGRPLACCGVVYVLAELNLL